MDTRLFKPKISYTISATTVSTALPIDLFSESVQIHNKGPNDVYIKFGVDPVVATIGDMHIAAGTIEVFNKETFQNMAAITDSGASTLKISVGSGI